MHDDRDHVDVRTARRAALVGTALWVVIAYALRPAIGSVALMAISVLGLPLSALWTISIVESARRVRAA
jgi:hypothetical protein